MKANISKYGSIHKSQKILLALIKKGVSRQKAYDLIQKLSIETFEKNKNFEDLVKENYFIKKYINDKQLNSLFNDNEIKKINWIYKNKIQKNN